MKKIITVSAAILMITMLFTGCADTTAQVGQTVGNVTTAENNETAADKTLSPEELAAIEAEKAAKEEAEKNAAQRTEDAAEETKDRETAAPVTAAPTEPELSGSAIINGTLIYQDNWSCYMLVEYNSAEGWLILYEGDSKGYGTPCNALNINTGMEIQGEEGAEVYFCPEGILQMEWRYQNSGDRASAGTVLLYYPQSGKEPQTFDLYLIRYDFAGNKIGEEFIMSFTQTEEYVYSQVYDVVNPILASYGVSGAQYDYEMYSFNDENGDAVAYDGNGNEIARYPGKGADAMMMSISVKDDIMVISGMGYPSFTEIYRVN